MFDRYGGQRQGCVQVQGAGYGRTGFPCLCEGRKRIPTTDAVYPNMVGRSYRPVSGCSEERIKEVWWRRRESNPRPKMLLVKRLHAYSSSCPGHYLKTFATFAQNGQETPAASLKISSSPPRRSGEDQPSV